VSSITSWSIFATGIAVATMTSCASAAPAAINGETLFRQRCQMCHSVTAAAPATLGPNLKGVVGRPAASTTFNYSTALKQSKLNWTQADLDRYLSAPAKLVPGTRMAIALSDPAQRAAVIKFLSTTR
jgi:cytochrome c